MLREPLLHASLFFKAHRALYYELLDGVRVHGDWERWLDFFADELTARQRGRVFAYRDYMALLNAELPVQA